jgi:hypothetical protein
MMARTYNVYCDESCHLEHDGHRAMVLGAISCPRESSRQIAEHIRGIKALHRVHSDCELKWTKISPKRVNLYLGLVSYFFSESDLHFRALIVPDKTLLSDDKFDQSHDDWYYKMYFDMLKVLLKPADRYRIFIDIKDTRGAKRIEQLWKVLRSSIYDFDSKIVERVQQVRSHEVQQMQLADVLIGCISSINRGNTTSAAKRHVAEHFRRQSGYKLTQTTLLREEKVNLLLWRAQETNE